MKQRADKTTELWDKIVEKLRQGINLEELPGQAVTKTTKQVRRKSKPQLKAIRRTYNGE